MVQPKTLPQQVQAQSNSIATYDYTDIADGTGVRIFYGANTNIGGTNDYILTTDASIYSSSRAWEVDGATSTSFDFDLSPFNTPLTAKGTAIFSTGLGRVGGSIKLTVTLNHVRGATVTAITSAIDTITWGTSGAIMALITLPITEQRFQIGDFLRMTVLMTSTSGGFVEFGFDPIGRDSTRGITAANGATTTMKLNMPFRIDL